MTVYYYNGLPIVAPFSIESNQPLYVSETLSLRRLTASTGSQRWELSFKTQWTGGSGEYLSNLFAEYGSVKTMTMPQLWDVDRDMTINPTRHPQLLNAANAGQTSFTVSGSGTNGRLPAGSFISFSSHDKVYMTRNTVTFNGTNNPWIHIYPALQRSIPAGANNTLNFGPTVAFTYTVDTSNIPGITFTDGLMHEQASIRLIEAI